MARRIESSAVSYPLRFVVAGDSGAWPDPTADGIFSQLVRQVAELDPPAVFFANLGDFAGPGTIDRHRRYLELVEPLPIPNVCVIGNHDLDDASGPDSYAQVHGPTNFDVAYGHTRFVAINAAPGVPGLIEDPSAGTPEGIEGPREEDLEFLDSVLRSTEEPNRVVLMHMPPYANARLAPHVEWGFQRREQQFMDLLGAHHVGLVCCAHGLAFDTYVLAGVRVVMSGGGGTGLCSHYRGICTPGPGHPEDRGSLFHAVAITISESGEISGRVIQAFEHAGTPARLGF
jgi:hypothetical protein